MEYVLVAIIFILGGIGLYNLVKSCKKKSSFPLGEVQQTLVTPELITTNPPAKEIALKNREKQVQEKYDQIIKSINHAINRGDLETTYGLAVNNLTGQIYDDTILKAGRKIKADGFKVKIKTYKNIQTTQHNGIEYVELKTPITHISKSLYISWK